jgi:hypothetical protein
VQNGIEHLRRLSGAWAGTLPIWIMLWIYFVLQMHLAAQNTWFWYDELWSIWASHPWIPFSKAFLERMLPDANPPLYPVLLYLARMLVGESRLAIEALNITATVGAALAAFAIFRRARQPAMATVAFALLLFCGPVAAYTQEGRTYALTMSVLYVLTALCLVSLRQAAGRGRIVIACATSLAAALLHIYGALFCGCLGLVWVGYGLLARRADVARLGAWIMGSAVLTFAIWLAISLQYASARAAATAWLEASPDAIWVTLMRIRKEILGPPLFALVAVGLFGMLAVERSSRRTTALLAATAALFVGIPLLISLYRPVFFWRYALSGVPALLLMSAVATRDALVPVTAEPASWRRNVLAGIAALLGIILTVNGLFAGARYISEKNVWTGHLLLARYLGPCPSHELRAAVDESAIKLMGGFNFLMKRIGRSDVGIVDGSEAPPRDVSEIDCGAVGWIEDWRFDTHEEGLAPLLAALNLTNKEDRPIEVVRDGHSLVLVKPPEPR